MNTVHVSPWTPPRRLACCYRCQTITHIYAPLWTLFWCHPTPQRGNMFLCLWLRNIFLRLIASQALQSSMGVVLYVCAHGDGVDWFGCHPPTRLQPPPWPSCLCSISNAFNPSPSSCNHLLHAPPLQSLFHLVIPEHSWIRFRSHSFNPSYISNPTFALAFSFPLSFCLRSHSIVWRGFPLCSLTSL